MSIRARLILLVLSVLLPALGLAVWTVVATYRSEQQALERNLRDTTRALSLVVDRELAQRAAIAHVLSLSLALDNAPDVPPAELTLFEQQARRAVQGLSGWVVLRSERGELLNTRLLAGASPPAGTPRSVPLRDEPAVVPLALDAPGHGLQAAVVQPVRRRGRTVLNVAVTVLPAELQRIVDSHAVPANWVATLLDSDGAVVARSQGADAYIGRPASSGVKARLAAGKEGLYETVTGEGKPVLVYFSTSNYGWTYFTGAPRPVIAGYLSGAVSRVALAASALLALAVFGALWVSRRISAPIYSLKNAATRLGQDLAVEPFTTGIVECDQVAAALTEAAQTNRQARSHLEQQVAIAVAGTREAEQRVAQSQRIEALGRLTGGVAHDFNNLLGVISNSAYVIQRRSDNVQVQSSSAAILRAVEIGSRLTRHLLRFAGRQPLSPQAIDLAEYLPDVQHLIKAVVGSGVALKVEVASTMARITVDSSELELALINLALNARDAMAQGGELRLQARNAEAHECVPGSNGLCVVISMSDTGSGIAAEHLDRVFEPFFTTKAMGKGTGLGLSQVHGFAVQAGGTVRVVSPASVGTTVSLILPVGGAPAESTPRRTDAVLDAGLAGKHILLVEDNLELGEATEALLTSFGCSVQRARGAEEALRAVGEGARIDVVLSDVVMPGDLDGVAMALELRRRVPALPVVLISGFSGTREGTHDFTVLRKPSTPEALVAALLRAMQGPSR